MMDWLRRETRDPAVEVEGRVLPIAIRRHARAQRLTMRLAPDGSEVRITLPVWGRTLDAVTFAKARSKWIATQLERVPDRVEVGDGQTIQYRGEARPIRWCAAASRQPVIESGAIVLGGPAERIERRVRGWLETEAIRLLGEDLAYYCRQAGLEPPELRLSRAQRRWGSCSGQRRNGRGPCIRINWRLVMAPDHVRRSVVAHEVAHLVHFDHSPAFHALLAQLFEGAIADADLWLKKDGRTLYAAFG